VATGHPTVLPKVVDSAQQIADVTANTPIESLLAIYVLFGHSITRPIKHMQQFFFGHFPTVTT
jgi:hypothetical protein